MAKRKVTHVKPWPERLKELRAKLGDITQAEAAEKLGASLRAYISWELGEHVPHRLYQLAIVQLEKTVG